jgi:L-lactate dehydrogenase complex protein LldG
MSTGRDSFLQRVREAVAEGSRAGVAPALRPRGDIGYQGAGPDPVARFQAELAAAGGQAHLVADAESAAAKVIELLQARGCRRVLLGRGPVLDTLSLAGRLAAVGMEETPVDQLPAERGKELLFAADAAVSAVHTLIAETGTVVAAAAPPEPRSLTLLPPVHIAVAARRQLVPDLFDLLAAFPSADGVPPQLPSCLTLITGPSKTGDIELKLVTGVHGPGELHVVLLTGPA